MRECKTGRRVRTGVRTRLHHGSSSRSSPGAANSSGPRKDATAAAFLARAKVWFAAHGINHIHWVVTDNGACHRSGDFARIVGQGTRHQRTKPYTPRHNGKVERYQRITAEEVLYAREFTSEDARSAAIAVWNIHYNYHRPHSAAAGKPPAARLRESVTNVEPSYT
jgi:transposase InsO family protein